MEGGSTGLVIEGGVLDTRPSGSSFKNLLNACSDLFLPHSLYLFLRGIVMVFCIGYSTHVLPVGSSRWCIGETSSLEESKMAVAVGCLDSGKSLCHRRSCLRLSSEELGRSRGWLAPGTPSTQSTPGHGAPCGPGTRGTPPRVIATNPGDALVGMQLGDHCMILHNSHYPVPDHHPCSSSVTAHL